MELKEVQLALPPAYEIIIGQSHHLKTVEDLYEALANSMPGIKFGVSFCETIGKTLVRYDGTDPEAIQYAIDFASRISAGHVFVVMLKDARPMNVLNRIKAIEEVANVFCATGNSTITVVLAEVGGRRGIMGVVDGASPKGVESEPDKQERREWLRKNGYKR